MNLIQGKLVDSAQAEQLLPELQTLIGKTLSGPLLLPEVVINACEKLGATLSDETIFSVVEGLGVGSTQVSEYVRELRLVFSRKYLQQRLHVELGENYGAVDKKTPYDIKKAVEEHIYPLGVLFHIAAGNMDGLPIYSVIEGLLAGNINLLKLPSVDGGLTVMLLQKLCEIEPKLVEYIYVFELTSKETSSISQLMQLADGVVVWGGDEAVTAIRKVVPPNTRIIEWGHKLSFAYVTKKGITEHKLTQLAHNICTTNQLLCSSCQGVFLDGLTNAESVKFCQTFLTILENVAKGYPEVPLAAKAQNTLQLHTKKLENIYGAKTQIFKGEYASIVLEADSQLTVSLQYRNLWVKPLGRSQIVTHLHFYKNYLQTAALLCGEREWASLRDMLWRAGVVRISNGQDMSRGYCGAAHDGDYPLRRYTKVVSAQK